MGGFTSMKALCESADPARASIPFDRERSGFVMGEGAAILVLEELEHARARGAQILGEITGYGATCDAYHMTAPHPEAEGGAKAIADAWQEAGMDTDRVYYNAHGTSTPMNDKIETIAVKKALGEERARRIAISSTKSMTGHMLGAAGAAEAVISILALTEGIAPPTIGLTEADPECDLDVVPNEGRSVEIRYAMSNSLGFGGHNGSLLMKKWEA